MKANYEITYSLDIQGEACPMPAIATLEALPPVSYTHLRAHETMINLRVGPSCSIDKTSKPRFFASTGIEFIACGQSQSTSKTSPFFSCGKASKVAIAGIGQASPWISRL